MFYHVVRSSPYWFDQSFAQNSQGPIRAVLLAPILRQQEHWLFLYRSRPQHHHQQVLASPQSRPPIPPQPREVVVGIVEWRVWGGHGGQGGFKVPVVRFREMMRFSSRVMELLEASTNRVRKGIFDEGGRSDREYVRFKFNLHKILKQ